MFPPSRLARLNVALDPAMRGRGVHNSEPSARTVSIRSIYECLSVQVNTTGYGGRASELCLRRRV